MTASAPTTMTSCNKSNGNHLTAVMPGRWKLENGLAVDRTQHCYGPAFVLLVHTHALRIDISEAADGIAATFDLMEKLF